MKKIISFSLCLLLLVPFFTAFSAEAVKFDDGLDALRAQWSRGKGPSAGGYALEYSFFEPKNAKKSNPLPLFVFMAGAGEGTYSGEELKANGFAYWSSEELQARSHGDGAYLQILKAPEPVYFDSVPASSIYAAISDFASKHYVDKSRIYVCGWCIGAVGAANVAEKYPSYFAGLGLISPRVIISSSEAEKLKDMAVWIFGCTADTYSSYSLYVSPSWDHLKEKTRNKANIRLTSCTSAPRAAAIFNHMMWPLLEQDFGSAVLGNYKNLKTENGNGTEVSSPHVISWFTSKTSGNSASGGSSSDSGSSIWQKIVSFFKRFFSAIFSVFK